MKKLLAGLMALLLLMGSAAAEDYAPSNGAIMVDGVRTAFFSPEGMYLQPVEKDGLIYVPVDALGETLGIAVTSDAATQAVTVNGIRVAFFDAAGMYLPPIVINGLVYVPLTAFAESAGVDLVQEGNTYAFSRQAAQPAAPAPAPTAEPKPQHPEYVAVDLTTSNFGRYFSYKIGVENFKKWDQTYKTGGGYIYFKYFSCDYTLEVTALTSYRFENVRFTVYDPGNKDLSKYDVKGVTFDGLVMPQSGILSKKQAYEGSYINSWTAVSKGSDLLGKSLFGSNQTSVKNVSGRIYLPWEDVQDALESKYQQAQADMESGNYQSAVNRYRDLAGNQYKDAAQLLSAAEQKLAEQKAQKQQNDYAAAQALLDEGSFDEAEKAFEKLKDYKDSAAKVEEVKTARLEARYQDALNELQAENWDKANELFTALEGYKDSAAKAEEASEGKRAAHYDQAVGYAQQEQYAEAIEIFQSLGDYKDSAAKAEEARESQRSARYHQAVTYARQEQYAEAIEIFQSLGDYKDSPQQMDNCKTAQKQAAYAAAEELERQGKSLEAYNAFAALGDFEDSAQRAAGLKYYSAMNDAPALMAKGEFLKVLSSLSPYIETDPEASKMYWLAAFRVAGVAQPMSADGTGWVKVGSGYTLMDVEGKVITSVKYTNPGPWRDGYTLFKKSNGNYVYLDTMGQEAFGQEFKEAEDFNQGGALVTLLDGAKAVATDEGLVVKLPEKKGREYKSYVGEDMVSFVEKEKWGLINLKGKVVAKAKYTHGIDRFKNGMAKAYQKKNGEYYVPVPALINAKGKEGVKIFTYNDVIALGNDLIAGKNMNTDNYRIMNLKGKTHKNSRKGGYKNVDGQGSVILVQMDNKKWSALDLNLNPITTTESTAEIQVGAGGQALLFTKGGSMELFFTVPQSTMSLAKNSVKMSVDSPYVAVKNGTKGWGIYDSHGNQIY